MRELVESCGNGVCRPGGLRITAQAIETCGFEESARLLDVGCGNGETVRFLRERKYQAFGIDTSEEQIKVAFRKTEAGDTLFKQCNGEHLEQVKDWGPFSGVLFECSLSKIENDQRALLSAYQQLKYGGWLILSDFYAKGIPMELSGLMGRVETLEEKKQKLVAAGFEFVYFKDYSDTFKELLGQMIFDHGSCAVYSSIGGSREQLKELKAGYGLMIGRKK